MSVSSRAWSTEALSYHYLGHKSTRGSAHDPCESYVHCVCLGSELCKNGIFWVSIRCLHSRFLCSVFGEETQGWVLECFLRLCITFEFLKVSVEKRILYCKNRSLWASFWCLDSLFLWLMFGGGGKRLGFERFRRLHPIRVFKGIVEWRNIIVLSRLIRLIR